jgi:hypothetical protein
VNRPPKVKPEKIFDVKPTFFNPCKDSTEPSFKQLDTNGDLYTLNLKMKGLLNNEKEKKTEHQEPVQKPVVVESNENTNQSLKSPTYKKERDFNSNYQSNNYNDKYHYHNKNNNYYDNKKSVSNSFNPEMHPNYTANKKNYKYHGDSEEIWNQFTLEEENLDIEEEEFEQYNRGYLENDSYKNNYGNRNDYKSTQCIK